MIKVIVVAEAYHQKGSLFFPFRYPVLKELRGGSNGNGFISV
jgi:hypothetical protein